MYNVRVSAEFSNTNTNDQLYSSGTTRREGDLSEIHVADIYRGKCKTTACCYLICLGKVLFYLLSK